MLSASAAVAAERSVLATNVHSSRACLHFSKILAIFLQVHLHVSLLLLTSVFSYHVLLAQAA